MNKIKPLFILLTLITLSGLVYLNTRQSQQRAALEEAALSAADELTGLIGTGSTIDQLLDAAEKHGVHQRFRTGVLRCQHRGWEHGAQSAQPACEDLFRLAHTPDEKVRAKIETALVLKRLGKPVAANILLTGLTTDSPRLQAKLRLAQAEISFALSDDAAVARETKAILELSRDPSTRANALMYGGLSAARQGDMGQAETWLQQAIDIRTRQHSESPEYDEYTINLARAFKARGELPKHQEDLRTAEALIAPLRAREPTRAELTLDF